jgi:NTE family protein
LRFFKRERKVGLALSGGAARALSHVGVLEVLEEIGIKPRAISGTSMGAIIGAFYSMGITTDEMKSYIKSMNWKSFLLFSDLALSKTGIINGGKIEEVLKKFLGSKTFSDCKIPFCCVATDLVKKEKVILSEGKLIDAVRASISIPGFISVVYLNDKILVDGGIIEPLPVESLKSFDINLTIASSISFKREEEKYAKLLGEGLSKMDSGKKESGHYQKSVNDGKKKKIFNIKRAGIMQKRIPESLSVKRVIDTSFSIVQQELVKYCIKGADIVIEPEVGDFGFFDLMHGSEIIQRGVEAAREKIPEIRRKL